MKLKYITFEFDNFDEHTIEGEYVDYLRIEDIQTSFVSCAPGDVDRLDFVGSFSVEINSKANTVHHNPNAGNREYFPFKWLGYGDITQIKFELEDDDRKYSFPVMWSDTPSVNDFQKNYISKHGNMYIVINEHKGIEDFFNKELINKDGYKAEDYAALI